MSHPASQEKGDDIAAADDDGNGNGHERGNSKPLPKSDSFMIYACARAMGLQ